MVRKLRDRILKGPGGVDRPLTADEMLGYARSVDLGALDLEECSSFRTERYARNRILLNDHFELVVICWLPGQASSIHDHGESNCLYLVARGEMEEELFKVEGKKTESQRKRRFKRGDTTLAAGADVHRITNPGPEKLVTVHIYSPPLDERVTHFTPIPNYA